VKMVMGKALKNKFWKLNSMAKQLMMF